MPGTTNNQKLIEWVDHWTGVFQPAEVHWCDGSAEEYDAIAQQLVDGGTFERLDDAKRPNSYLALSDPDDVARVEDRTFIACEKEIDAGPTNNWRDPAELRSEMLELFSGAMKGRTMYVVPFSMGPLGSRIAHIGVQLTDSAYVAASMRIMTRMGQGALDVLGDGVEALRLVPRVLDTSSEAVRVLTLFVIGRDRSLQVLSFYVNPAAAQTSGDARRDHDACVELALRSARTLRAGGRSLATGATETLEAGTRHLQVTLPPQGTLLTQPGPDFVVYRLFDLLPFGAPRVTGFVYFGGHPMNIRTSTDIIEQDVFGAPARFYAIALEDGATRLDLMEDVGHGYYAHVQLTVPAGASAASWLAALRDARFVP